MRRSTAAFALLVASALAAGPACESDKPVAPINVGSVECDELGPLCHDAGERLHGRYEECHLIGHKGDGKVCLMVYEECKALCESAPTGEGGAGGEAGAAAH